MRTPPDLHEYDLGTRENLRDALVEVRVYKGLTQRALGKRIGVVPSAVGQMENRVNWQISTVQRWAGGLDLRLVLRPDCLPFDSLDVLQYLLRPTDPAAAMAFDRRALIEGLVEARRWVGMSQQRVAQRLGISEKGVGAIEHERDVMLVTAQRYCRALDLSLAVELEEVSPTWPN